MDGGLERARHRSLPVQLTGFFGRQREADELLGLLQYTRLLTLVGAPGCGKTRLGVEVATRLAPELADGAQLVELAPLAPGSDVGDAIGAALRIPEHPHQASIDTLAEALRSAELLLVLDNCEHLVGGVAKTLDCLLQACPGVRVLATGRTPLRVIGEQVWPVPPLDKEAAVELFRDRAELANGGFQLDEHGRELVETICNRLDHLPLALELTAARTRVLSPGQIVQRLDDALPLMSDGVHSPAARHETMQATVDWSYRQLSPDDQQLFEQLSVFAGGFDLAAVEAVTDREGDALRGLTSLVDHSLVFTEAVSQDSMRYGLLEPVRQCGETHLAQRGWTDDVRRRHAEHYVGVAHQADEELRVADGVQAMRRMERERSNFRQAYEWARWRRPDLGLRLATAAARHLVFSGRVKQGRGWLEEMLSLDGADPRMRAAGLGRLGVLAWREGDYGAARSHLEESRALFDGMGDELAMARRVRGLGLVALSEADFRTAARLSDQAVEVFRRYDDKAGAGWALVDRGWVHYMLGEIEAGDECLWEAVAASEAVPDHTLRVQARNALAYGAHVRHDAAAERTHLVEARSACEEGSHGIEPHEPEWMWSCFRLAISEGRSRTALRLAGGALELGRSTGSVAPAPLLEDVEPKLQAVRDEVGAALADRLMEQGAKTPLLDLMTEALTLPPDPEDPLTVREAEVAELVGEGLSNVEIAERLFISRRTVESHLEHIRRKLGLGSRHELMAWVLRGREPSCPQNR